MESSEVIIVGAGLAGLCCGRRLAQCGVPFRIVEASNGVGGRVRTDLVEGFRLDRGFQILLTAYPEARRVLDLEALQLRPFRRGALIRYGGRFHRLVHPREAPFGAFRSLFNPIGTFRDKFRMLLFVMEMRRGRPESAWGKPEKPAIDLLRWQGRFTPKMIDRFFRPFFGGVFFDPDLGTSSRAVRYIFRMFASGEAVVPALGMQAIPDQIAAGLPADSIQLGRRVESVQPGAVMFADGEHQTVRAVVIATEGTESHRLLNDGTPAPAFRGTTTLHYAVSRPPLEEPILVLDGDRTGPVNNLVVISAAAPTYAPSGMHLITASTIGVPTDTDDRLDSTARRQLRGWFGGDVDTWRLLRVDCLPRALPDQTAGALDPPQRPIRLRPGLYVCGDHRDNASIDGAMTSGFRAAQIVMEDLHRGLT